MTPGPSGVPARPGAVQVLNAWLELPWALHLGVTVDLRLEVYVNLLVLSEYTFAI